MSTDSSPAFPGHADTAEHTSLHPHGTLPNDRIARVDVPALLEEGRTRCAAGLRAAVARLASPMDVAAAYHFGWLDVQGRPSGRTGGKALRPALALLSAEVTGAGDGPGLPGAVAVELLHNFSLVHDDLMDGDEQRRHRDTVWKRHGPETAILVGDGLLALAMEVILEVDSVRAAHRAARTLTTASRALIDGQSRDLSYERREQVTLEECLHMAGEKTGALLACSASIGAVLSGTDDRTGQALWDYGYQLGLAFQAVDDLLGIWGDPRVTGKQQWGDLRRRKKSLPVVAAAESGSTAGQRLRELLADDAGHGSHAELTDEELAMRAALVEEAGGRTWTLQEAWRRRNAAIRALDSVSMPDAVRQRFVAIPDFVVARVG
ncbi:polyprenyl synthetase family protein [Streptomyces capillispiralis]|uniref:Geranylgeranyl diphosphate synthase type I n=1 Tax=Streptomyces capillispiralis TaxID=68182 RepID=A0A561SGL0_9ACTN|nr:polyprenyl synthetase family protein [Streptomyces capillispiralis]TWF73988.1 geranylgeranyl diphosphate synthase type I [Streptomyces capillispiralis]GHH96323.1 dimethylallyltransferase [Streptomyces capillispiralis]